MAKAQTPEEKFVERLRVMFRMLGSDNDFERETARGRIKALLEKHRKTWNDAVEMLQTGDASNWNVQDENAGATVPGVAHASGSKVTALDLIYHMLQAYVGMQPHEHIATSLWIAHAHAFSRFMITPRLALTSPVRGCGKTTLLKIIERLVPRARRMDGVSAAAIYRLVDREHCTLLVDEADNLGLFTDGPMRATFNSGHAKGGRIVRAWKDGVREYSTFAPMAIAAIGALPLPISHRSVTIHMSRYAGADPLRRFDDTNTVDLDITYGQILLWARKVKLASDPELPDVLRNRQADNWRPLIAIADTFGPAWGRAAREAALMFAKGYSDEDVAVVLLRDIRDCFDTAGVDRFTSAALASTSDDPRHRGIDSRHVASRVACNFRQWMAIIENAR
jgi:Protein of unknown function (DUF3631)